MAQRKLEYTGLTFADFLNLGKYGTPPRSQAGSLSGSPQEAKVTPPLAQVNPCIHPEGLGSKSGTFTINPIQEKNTPDQPTSRDEAEISDIGGETVEFTSDGGAQDSSHAEAVEPAPSVEAVEEPEESGDVVDQDAWINVGIYLAIPV